MVIADLSLRNFALNTHQNSDHAAFPFTWIVTVFVSRCRTENMPLDGVKALLLAQRIDKLDFGRVIPNWREQLQIYRINSLGVLLYKPIDRCDIGRRPCVSLRGGVSGNETENSGEQTARQHGVFRI